MPYHQVTRLQLREQLQAKWEDVPFWTDTEANFAINETLQWYNLYTGVWRQRVGLTTVADQVYYTLPAPITMGVRASYNGQSILLSSLPDLDNGHPGWEGQTTATVGAPDQVQMWSPIDLYTIAIWPADHAGQNNLLFDGVIATPTLDTDAATIDLPDSDVNAIVGEALCLATFKDPGRAPRLTEWHQNFLATVAQRNRRLMAADQFRPAEGTDQGRVTRPAEL